MLSPRVDIELGGQCARLLDSPAGQAEPGDLVSVLEHKYGRRPTLYVFRDSYTEFVVGQFNDHSIWIADIFKYPRLPDGRDWTFWLFANWKHGAGV
jgi:lysozyme